MAEFKLNYTGSEINQRLAKVDRIDSKADLIGGKVPLSQLPDDVGGLKEVDWETNVINKPFEDTRVIAKYSYAENPNPVSFDCTAINYSFYKISDLVLTKEEVFGAKFTINGREIDKFAENDILIETDELLVVQDTSVSNGNGYGFCFCNTVGTCNFTVMGYSLSMDVPEVGIYRVNYLGAGMSDIDTIEIFISGELKTLDSKYIADMYYDTRAISNYSQAENPNPIAFHNEMLQMSFYKVSDFVLTKDEIFNKLKIFVDEDKRDITPLEDHILIDLEDFIVTTDGIWTFVFTGVTGTVNFTHSGYQISFDVPEVGIYYGRNLNADIPEGRIFEFICGGELKTIDPKFIPANLDFDLSDYYTKVEVDTAINSIDLSEYYTKTEIDNLIGDVDAVLDEINTLIGE